MSEHDQRANPFVGLRPFLVEDSLYFFGRDQQIAELLEILRQHRFLGVVGSSGSGKSSLVRAGLLPGLLGGFLVRDRDRWRTAQIRPGFAPIGNLAEGLLEAMRGGDSITETRGTLERLIREEHTDAVVNFLKPRLEPNANIFLLVDQFEEIFSFRGVDIDDVADSGDPQRRKELALRKAEASDFVDVILALAEQRELPIYVTLTMRTDFLGDCDLFYGLPEALNRGRYLVPRMTREQLRDAVECPALLQGANMAPRLLDHVLNDLGDRFDRLPVLQHALLRTWDAWRSEGSIGPIDLRHFEAAGGLEGALNKDAEGALDGFDLDVAARVFKRLTDTDLARRRIRSPARISELLDATIQRYERAPGVFGFRRPQPDTVKLIVRRFAEDGRSFVHRSADGESNDERVDISHESLIRQWYRLRKWVDEESEARDVYRELVAKARKRERQEAALLQDPELQTIIEWRERVEPSPGWASRYSEAAGDFDSAMKYLDESVSVRCRNLAEVEEGRRWRRVWSPMVLLAEVAIGLWLANATGFLTNFDKIGYTPDPIMVRATPFRDMMSAVWSLPSLIMVLFLGACVGASLGLRWMHRRVAIPRILRRIVASGGRMPIEDEAATEGLQDAVVPRDVTYATTLRRIRGAVVDGVIVFVSTVVLLAAALLLAPTLLMPVDYKYTLTRGADTVSAPSSEVHYDRIEYFTVDGTDSTGRRVSAVTRSLRTVTRTLADGKQDTIPVRPLMIPDDTAATGSVYINFDAGPTLTGTLERGAETWTMTVTDSATVRDTAGLSVYVVPGTIVKFPAPDPAGWQMTYEFPSGKREIIVGLVLLLVMGWLYSALQISGRRQATWGMRRARIFRTDVNGKRLTFARASALFGYRILAFILWPGLFVQPFTRKRQALHDWMGGSVVLRGAPPGTEVRSKKT